MLGQLNLMCPKHGESIISAKFTERGDHQMSCLKCFTENEVTIEQLAQQLTDLRQKKIQNFIEQGSQSEKRLGSIKKVFFNLKEQLNSQIEKIIESINYKINIMNQNILKETDILKQPIYEMNITQVNTHIKELRQQQEIKNDQSIHQDEQLINQVIQQCQELAKSLDILIQQESDWKRQNETIKDSEIVNQNPKIVIREQLQPKQYESPQKYSGIYFCYAIAMDKDEKILVNGQENNIQIWDFNADGTMQLIQTLNGHIDYIRCLCFSKKGHWFISGSDDQSIRIWIRKDKDEWICKNVLKKAHSNWIYGIILNNNEDQLISCSRDTTIKVWIKNNGWENIQTLKGHEESARFLSFNHDCSILASSGDDGLRIWENDKIWKLKQMIQKPSEDYYVRIKQINKNELIVSTYQQCIQRFTLNNEGIFQLESSKKLNDNNDYDCCSFPIIYNEQLQLVFVKQRGKVYVLKNDNGEFIIQQIIQGDYRAGYLQKDGKYLILSETQHITILQ